jgi:diguanylate cyclase (GGDEF)-like protein
MKQQPIGFRELLEQVLPLEQLRPQERSRVQRALLGGVARELEAAAMMAMERLADAGALRRISPAGGDTIRYQETEAANVITVQLPTATERDGVLFCPRAILPARAGTDLTQVRRLLHMEEVGLLSDPRSSQARAILHEHLGQAGLELVGTADLHLFSLPDPTVEGKETPLDGELAVEALARPGTLFYCPDLTSSRGLARHARTGLRSVAWIAVVSSEQEPLGLLEVRSSEPATFQAEDLARVALIADFCGTVLERAARLEKLVFVDSTTGVYNRSYFELQARNEMARAQREQASVALCIADIDDFKAVNTSYGYEAGNAVLTQVAQTLKRGVRPFDTVARWGGEEFAVLLTAPVQPEDVAAICERLRVAVERLVFHVEGLDRRLYPIRLSVSMGVAVFPEHGTDPQELWRAANQALLIAKRPPKNRVVFHRRVSAVG